MRNSFPDVFIHGSAEIYSTFSDKVVMSLPEATYRLSDQACEKLLVLSSNTADVQRFCNELFLEEVTEQFKETLVKDRVMKKRMGRIKWEAKLALECVTLHFDEDHIAPLYRKIIDRSLQGGPYTKLIEENLHHVLRYLRSEHQALSTF